VSSRRVIGNEIQLDAVLQKRFQGGEQEAETTCLTVAELKRMWEPAAQGKVTRWNQIRPSFPDRPLTLVGPGAESGTFDYFTLAIVGREGESPRLHREQR
jgi:ABC-type phosphate transport system substrate-binding protein